MEYEQIKRYKIEILLLSLLVSFAFYLLFLYPHFSVDSYNYAGDFPIANIFTNGRPITFTFLNILSLLNLNYKIIFTLSTFFAIVIISLSSYVVFLTLIGRKEKWSKLNVAILILSVILLFNNVFMGALFLFPEVILPYSLGILLCSLAFRRVVNHGITLKNSLILFIYLSMVLAIYQSFAPYFLLLTFAVIFSYPQTFSQNRFIAFIWTLGMYFFSLLTNFFLIRFSDGQRTNFDIIVIKDNLIKIINSQKLLIMHSDNLMPSYIFATTLFILAITFVFWCLKKAGKTYVLIGSVFFILTYLSILSPFIIANDGFITPRSIVVFMGLPSFLAVIVSSGQENRVDKTLKFFKAISICLLIGLILGNFASNQFLFSNQLATNRMDKEIVIQVQNVIDDYEDKTGTNVTKISFKQDTSPTWSYVEANSYDVLPRSMVVDWSIMSLFKLYTGREYTRVEMNSEVDEKYFNDQNWSQFSLEQIKILDDTIYIALY